MTVTEDQSKDLNGSRNTSHFENESWIENPGRSSRLWYSDFKRGSIKLAKRVILGKLRSFKDYYLNVGRRSS